MGSDFLRTTSCALAVFAAFLISSHALAEGRFVARVLEGDVLQLSGGERVHLIGVETPETVHPEESVERYGKEAKAFTRRLAQGKEVTLGYEAGGATKDRYGRTLAYVYLPDGLLLNLEIVRQGYGFVSARFPFSRIPEFQEAENQAREARRGLWGRKKTADQP